MVWVKVIFTEGICVNSSHDWARYYLERLTARDRNDQRLGNISRQDAQTLEASSCLTAWKYGNVVKAFDHNKLNWQ